MKRTIRLVALFAGAALFVAAFLLLLTTHGPLAPVDVQTGAAVRADLSPTVFGIGVVEARLAYAVGPVAPGRVLRVLVDQGDEVKAGQLLAEMDPVDLDRRVQAAQSAGSRTRQSVRAAEALEAQAASRADFARANRERDLGLLRQNVIPRQALDASSHEADLAEAALAAARANVAAAAQDVARTEAELRGVASLRTNLRLLSPVDGIVVSREAEPGTTVVGGQALLRLVVPGSMWVRARVDQSRAHGLQVGQPARIVLRSTPDTVLPGRVARIEMQSDAVTEERVVDVAFDSPPARLFLGELAETTILLPGEPAVLVVPSAAIARENGRTGVWQAVDGRAQFKPVRVHSQGQAELTQVRSGLDVGEVVVVYSSAQLKDGVRLRAREVGGR